jgi:hypothetical protein
MGARSGISRLDSALDSIPRRSGCVSVTSPECLIGRPRVPVDAVTTACPGRCNAEGRLASAVSDGLCYGRTRSADTPRIRLPVGGSIGSRYHLQVWACSAVACACAHQVQIGRKDDIAQQRAVARDTIRRRIAISVALASYVQTNSHTV